MTLDHLFRLGRWNETAPTASRRVLTDLPAPLFAAPLGLFLRQERSDRLVESFERGVLSVDDDLRHDGDDVLRNVTSTELVQQALLQDVAQAALGHRDQHVQRHRGDIVPRLLVLQQQVADLRSVAVRDDEVVASLDQAQQQPGDVIGVALVVLDRARLALLHERVAAHGDERDRFGLGHPLVSWEPRRGAPTGDP